MAYLANTCTVTQEFLQWLNRQSNCNVLAQQHVSVNVACEFRLLCTVCKASLPLFDLPRIAEPMLEAFCVQHQHLVPILGTSKAVAPWNTELPKPTAQPTGRRFRDE